MATTNAIEMANKVGVDPKRFRAALREQNFRWHKSYKPWTVELRSGEFEDMQRVLNELRQTREQT
jgi:hypothetical protein